ncbi:MAG TPA: hypothetical protein VGX23_27720 [Actinocrinis sp.]|nr:hypothetical protein [Actinocrinis sp.]
MVGISAFEPGALVAGRYRVVERLTRFAIFDHAISGVEFEYWLAVDESRGTEVWLQAASAGDVAADGATLAGAVAAIRRMNHPAIPIVLDFGEIEVELARARRELAVADAGIQDTEVELALADDAVIEDVVEDSVTDAAVIAAADEEIADAEIEDAVALEAEAGLVRRIGYTVLAPVEGESLAAVLLRGVLAEVEIMSVLAEVAEVLELLHEEELVHAHLSPYSIVLTETGVLVVDLAVALAVEAVAETDLTVAADVYALAWLACVALVGFEVIEAEFGAGFVAAAAAGELVAEGMPVELILRRRRWAELNLVATYGLSAELAALLIAGLSEAAARPDADMLTAAFRGRPLGAVRKRPSADVAATAVAAEAGAGGIFVGAVAGRSGSKSGGVTAAVGGLAAAETVESVESVEVVETGVVETERVAVLETGAAAFAVGAGAGAGMAAGMYAAEMGMAAPAAPTVESATAETVTSRRTAAAAAAETAAAATVAGAAIGFGAAGLAEAGGSAGFETVTIPKVVPRGGAAAPHAPGPQYTASPSAPVSPSAPRGPRGPVSPVSPSSPSSPAPGRRAKKRGRAGVLLPIALGLAVVLVVGVIWVLFGTSKKVATATTANAVPTTAPAIAQTTQASNLGQVVLPTVTPTQDNAPTGTVTIVPTIPEGTPPAVAPSSPKQALQQIQGLVNQSSSNLSPESSVALKGALGLLQHEIDTGGSVTAGVTTLRQILVQNTLPSGLAGQINELIPFLNTSSGS